MQNIQTLTLTRTNDNAAPSTTTDNPLETNNNPNQQEPVETSENGVSTSPSTDNPQSAEIIEGSVATGATAGSTKSNPLSALQAMSEDRHTLSQPRFLPPATPQAVSAIAEARLMHPKLTASETTSLKKNARPYEGAVFLVDVFRNGVDDPVDTVVITDETLPPRKNRKGKVAWRLPDLESAKGRRLPSFASDERKRIFDLFKERKRNRKKLLRKTSTLSSIVSVQSADESGSATAVSAAATGEPSGSGASAVASEAVAKPAAMSSGSQGWSRGRIKTADGSNNDVMADDASAVAVDRDDGKKDENVAIGYDPGEGLGSPSTKSEEKASKRGGKKNRETRSETRTSDDEENGNEEKSGLSSASTNTLSQGNNDAIQSERNEPNSDKNGPDDPLNEEALPLKAIVVLKADRPQPNVLDPSPSLSVPAAKAFIDLYYPHITSGLSDDLAMYYSPGAQKSVSIGGAHSVVTGRVNIQLQIASFVGSQFVVKSVVAQNTVGGAFVLISGIVQTSPSAGSQVSSFAHSVNLVAATTHAGCGGDPEASILIFNDALMLMKVSDPVPPPPQAPLGMGPQYESAPGMVGAFPRGPFSTNVPSQPQQQQPLPQQQQHHSPPPPGLLPPGFQF